MRATSEQPSLCRGGSGPRSIAYWGSDEQKNRWLPALATAQQYGAFALTEPTHGSDSVGLETSATNTEGGFLLNGKKWIGDGSSAESPSCGPAGTTGRCTGS
ncbi:acyl-CoA dehydrogenase family protein [Arthrobacter globiformis]|uniref:acyl-CoA dehydrogenase family protein n=1 Tax=Arthrobacter globiformis TaxID=1665 RepID=UPI0027D7D544|nr:acyl-CoA dehydrogenase family protein [Arthrobacter globiformis]